MEIRATDPQRARKPTGRNVHKHKNKNPRNMIQNLWYGYLRSTGFPSGLTLTCFCFLRVVFVFVFLHQLWVERWERQVPLPLPPWPFWQRHGEISPNTSAFIIKLQPWDKNNGWLHTCCLFQPTACAEAHVLAIEFKSLAEL